MVFQAFIDDSYNKGGTFVLGGHIASEETWTAFSKDWEELLPFGTIAKDGRRHFKMSEMMSSPGRAENVAPFLKVIENHKVYPVACVLNEKDIHKAIARIFVPGKTVDWNDFKHPFRLAFRVLIEELHKDMKKLKEYVGCSPEEKIDFIFDNQSEQKMIRQGWQDFIGNMPAEYRPFYGNSPRFEDDKEFLPIQAADLFAGLVRRTMEDGSYKRNTFTNIPNWMGFKKPKDAIMLHISEEQIVNFFKALVYGTQGGHTVMYDMKYLNGGGMYWSV